MFENLRLMLAKKRCEWECNKTIIFENFFGFPFVKTSGFHLKVFVFKLDQIHICQTTIVEKHLRRYYVRMNSMSQGFPFKKIFRGHCDSQVVDFGGHFQFERVTY